MSDLIILVGISGSGKSTLGNMIKTSYQKENRRILLISSDEIRGELFGDESNQEHNDLVFKELHRRVNNSISKNNIIIDATNITVKSRRPILEMFKNRQDIRKIAIVMCTPVAYCKKQNRLRERQVPDYVIDNQVKKFEIPFYEEGFDEIRLSCWNDGYFTDGEQEVLRGKPDKDYILDLMKGFDQKTRHHKYTLDVHCKKCAEEVAKRTNNKVLIRAAEIHDIGKLYTGEPKEDGSGDYKYYSHPNVGTYYLLQNLDFIGLERYEDVIKCLFYVNYHMLPFFINTEKAKKKWEKTLSLQGFQDLLLFNECDKIASGR